MEQLAAGTLVFDARTAGPVDGPLVLLLHGFPQTSRCWVSQLDALGDAGYRAVAFDQRGYSPGARPPAVGDYAVPRLVADVLGIADAVGVNRFHLVGHDWGGAVAWQTAGRHADRLRSLTVVSTPHPRALTRALRSGDPDQAERSSYMTFFQEEGVAEAALLDDGAAGLRAVYARSGVPEAAVESYVEHLARPGALTAALNWYRAASYADVVGMGSVETPTLYVWSTGDAALGREAAEATGTEVAGPYRFEVLAGVTHWVPEVAAARLTELVLAHLEANPG